MMKSAEDAISKIPFVKCEGRQNLDFAAWKKSFATSMGQRYGELLEVNRTAEVFTYTALIVLAVIFYFIMYGLSYWKYTCRRVKGDSTEGTTNNIFNFFVGSSV